MDYYEPTLPFSQFAARINVGTPILSPSAYAVDASKSQAKQTRHASHRKLMNFWIVVLTLGPVVWKFMLMIMLVLQS